MSFFCMPLNLSILLCFWTWENRFEPNHMRPVVTTSKFHPPLWKGHRESKYGEFHFGTDRNRIFQDWEYQREVEGFKEDFRNFSSFFEEFDESWTAVSSVSSKHLNQQHVRCTWWKLSRSPWGRSARRIRSWHGCIPKIGWRWVFGLRCPWFWQFYYRLDAPDSDSYITFPLWCSKRDRLVERRQKFVILFILRFSVYSDWESFSNEAICMLIII